MKTTWPIYSIVALTLACAPAFAGCSNGDREDAYTLGHTMAFQGIDTSARHEVAAPLRTCFALGYREGRLQRMLRTGQPNPPAVKLLRPRTTRKG